MSIQVSPEVLSAAGYKNLAAKSQFDRTLTKEKIAEVHANAKNELDSLHEALTTSNSAKRNPVLDEHMKDDATRQALVELIAQVRKNQGVSTPVVNSAHAANGGDVQKRGKGTDSYRTGPLKESQDPKNKLEVLKGNETAARMGETIKRNISLLHTRIRENYVRHIDDVLLGSVVNFRDEYEHYGRILTNGLAQIGTPGFTIDSDVGSGDNVVNYSNRGASALIDLIVSQYGNGKSELEFQRGFQKKQFNSPEEKDKAILEKLQEINEGLVDEDGWLGLAIGFPIAAYISAKVTLPIMKWGIGKVPFVGKPALALTAEVYEQLERAAKGVGASSKTLGQSVRDRLKAQKAEGAPTAELTPEQKTLKEVQIEGAKEVVKEYLFEKYGKSYANYDAFIKDLDAGGMAKNGEIRRASKEMHSLTATIGKHLPVDVTVMDGWELETKLRQIGLDMPLGVWGGMKSTFYRFIFEKGSIANLVFQNKYVRLSERTSSGMYTDRVSDTAARLAPHFDRVEIEHGGEKFLVLRTDASMIQEVMKHVDAQIARESITREVELSKEIHDLEAKIKKLKGANIPDTEQGVKKMEAKLQDIIAQYDAYANAEGLEEQKRQKGEQRDKLNEHKALLEEYRTYQESQQAGARMQSVIDELRGEGLWDDTSSRPNKTKTQIDGEIRTINTEISAIDATIRNLSGKTSGSTSPEIRADDGALKQKSAIEGRKAQVTQMGKHIADKGEKTAKITSAESRRVEAVKRTGISEDAASKLTPKNGKLDASAKTTLDAIAQRVADTQVSFDEWKARVNPRYSIEIKDGKMLVKEGTRVEAILDPSKPAEAAKLLEKFGKR